MIDRWVIVLSTGHLLFHMDAGEYTPLRAVGPFLSESTLSIFVDGARRREFVEACTAPPHGPSITPTLVWTGAMTHFAAVHLGASLSTLMTKAIALAVSTCALAAWLLLLVRAWPRTGLLVRFGLLCLAAPPLLLKLSLMSWGSHELVLLVLPLFLLVFFPWIVRPCVGLRALARACVIGAVGGGLTVLHGTLILPAAFLGFWLLLGSAGRVWREQSRLRAGLVAVGMGLLGVGLFFAGWWGVASWPDMQAIGIGLSPLGTNDFGTMAGGALASPSAWLERLGPGGRFATREFAQELPLWVGMVCAVDLLLRAAFRTTRASSSQGGTQHSGPLDHPLGLFLSGYLLVSWTVVHGIPLELGETRYLAPLYPVSLAVVALWTLGQRPGLRALVLVALLSLQLPGHLGLLDVGNVEAGSRYDGSRMYYAFHGPEELVPPAERTPLGGATESFVQGMRLLTHYQWQNSYWDWFTAPEARALDHVAMLDAYLGDSDAARADPRPGGADHDRRIVELGRMDTAGFWRGVGYAYRILFAPDRSELFLPVLESRPEVRALIEAGYELAPGALAPTSASATPPEEEGCPLGMVLVEGGTYRLGETDAEAFARWVPDYVLLEGEVTLESFCMDEFPFPAEQGKAWPRDGLDLETVGLLDEALAQHGRRLCSLFEVVLASAGPTNQRYPYAGQTPQEGLCDPDDASPKPLGSYPACRSPMGFADFLVRGTWARVDDVARARLQALGAHHGAGGQSAYVVAGGMGRQDTIQAPSNFGFHFHVKGEPRFEDDGVRVCADPAAADPRRDAAYGKWRERFYERGFFADLLDAWP
ncbi:MAG TPA: hypothetical protein DIU15_20040 [Deltaproteobacteria bacterium]|nr:hypothetical protein [Deltaproteobacteria bacterium]